MNGGDDSLRADKVIEAFVTYLAEKLYPGLQIVDWPDKTNPRTSDIDAIAEDGGKRVAIEHTSVDFLPDQRRHNDRFMKVIGCLDKELEGQMNYRLRLITPFGSVPTGTSWDKLQDSLRRWILREAPLLPTGETIDIINIAGVPFPLTVQKSLSGPNGLFLARSVKQESDFARRLPLQIDRKALKLAKYKNSCDLLVLLVENDDLANMSRAIMINAVTRSYPHRLPNGLDRIWYADSSVPESIQFWNITPASRKNMSSMNALEELESPPE
jgi:hypothetical protein